MDLHDDDDYGAAAFSTKSRGKNKPISQFCCDRAAVYPMEQGRNQLKFSGG